MRLYEIDSRTSINLDAVQYTEMLWNGRVTLHLVTASFTVTADQWEEIKKQLKQ